MRVAKRQASSRPPDGHAIDPHGRDPDAHRYALAFLAAHPDAFVQLQIVADHADIFHCLRPVADQRGVAYWARELAIFDEITFRSREHEIAARDIHLAAAEVGAVKAARHGAD